MNATGWIFSHNRPGCKQTCAVLSEKHRGKSMHRIPVRQLMQTAVITIRPEALVADAAQLLDEQHLRRLPVVDTDGCLVGIVTDADIREAEAASSTMSRYDPGAEEEWLAVADVM